MSLTGRPIQAKRAVPQKDKARLEAVAQLPCVICWEWGMPQQSPTQVHHCIHGRHSMGRKSPDCMTIPLCEGHHQGDLDTSKIALHREPKRWRDEYGRDFEWIEWTNEKIGELQ